MSSAQYCTESSGRGGGQDLVGRNLPPVAGLLRRRVEELRRVRRGRQLADGQELDLYTNESPLLAKSPGQVQDVLRRVKMALE